MTTAAMHLTAYSGLRDSSHISYERARCLRRLRPRATHNLLLPRAEASLSNPRTNTQKLRCDSAINVR